VHNSGEKTKLNSERNTGTTLHWRHGHGDERHGLETWSQRDIETYDMETGQYGDMETCRHAALFRKRYNKS
jgi:hypothetical protein